MPIHFSVYPFGRLITYTVEGVPTPEESRAFLNAVLADRHFHRGFAFLGEATTRDIPHAAFTTNIAREVQAQASRLVPCKWAVLVSSEAGHGLVMKRAAVTQGCGVEVATFLTLDEATNWLGTISQSPERGADGKHSEDRDDSPSPRLSPLGSP